MKDCVTLEKPFHALLIQEELLVACTSLWVTFSFGTILERVNEMLVNTVFCDWLELIVLFTFSFSFSGPICIDEKHKMTVKREPWFAILLPVLPFK